jgi:hypothetical protein
MVSRVLTSESYKLLILFLFFVGVLLLYLKQMELFILFVLILNQEFFFLLPRESLIGTVNFQDFLYTVLFITGGWYFLREKRQNKANFDTWIIAFMFIIFLGVFYSYFHGQPLILSIKAAKPYFLVLFYFVFMGRNINTKKLFRFVVITGVFLALLNNIQYIYYGELRIFYASSNMERAGQLRFLIGDFFTIFSPIIALGEYLKAKKKIYLIASIYMIGTVFIQGKTRAVMGGLIVTILLLFYFSKRISFLKAFLIGIPLFTIFIWLGPHIRPTFIEEILKDTKYEFGRKTGNVGIRFNAYDYFFGEIMKSPIVGRGIWNESFKGDNPEDMSVKGYQLDDIGMTRLIFHFGLIGAIWLLIIIVKACKIAFLGLGKLRENIPYGLIGYFLFSIFTALTLNSFTHERTIIYFMLVLALLNQSNNSDQKV